MSYVPDAFDAFDRHNARQEAAERNWVRRLPVCSECGHPIRSENCWKIGDELFCEECIDGFQDYTENHMRG